MATDHSNPGVKPPASRAYERMKAAAPDEFEPRSIFLSTPWLRGYHVDWKSCFPVKAAVVYRSVTGKPVNKQTELASRLLIEIAKNCLPMKTQEDKAAAAPKPVTAAPATPATVPTASEAPKPERQPVDIEKLSDEMKETIDGIYLVVGFLAGLNDAASRESMDDKLIPAHGKEAVADIIKVENQLPLRVLVDIVTHIEAMKWKTVGVEITGTDKDKPLTSLKKGDLPKIVSRFCSYYSPFYSKGQLDDSTFKTVEETRKREDLLDCLHFSLARPGNGHQPIVEGLSGDVSHAPRARRLARAGVRLRGSEAGGVRLQFTEPNLEVPALVFDYKLETVAWNLLAWECLHGGYQKPVTRYFQLINELVGDVGDVRLMKKAGVLRSGREKVQQVLGLVKRLDGLPTYPSVYMAVDTEMKKVVDFHDKRMKNFLVKNRPAVIWVSSVAAASVVLTAVYHRSRKRG